MSGSVVTRHMLLDIAAAAKKLVARVERPGNWKLPKGLSVLDLHTIQALEH